MKRTNIPHLIISLTAMVFSVLYISMYLPIWSGNELTASGLLPIALLLFQIATFLVSVANLGYHVSKKNTGGRVVATLELVTALCAYFSFLILSFVGGLFILELFHIPWFPAQR